MANTKIVFDADGTGRSQLELLSQTDEQRVDGTDDARGVQWFDEAAARVRANDELDKKRMRERLKEKRMKKKMKLKQRSGEDREVAAVMIGGADEGEHSSDSDGDGDRGDGSGDDVNAATPRVPATLEEQEQHALRLLDNL